MTEDLEAAFLFIEVFCAECIVLDVVSYEERLVFESAWAHLVLLENTELLSRLWLRSLFVVAPLDGISHGRHDDC